MSKLIVCVCDYGELYWWANVRGTSFIKCFLKKDFPSKLSAENEIIRLYNESIKQ